MKSRKHLVALGVIAFAAASNAGAAVVPIAGYDIDNTPLSGHGGWAHAYSGTITPGIAFNNSGWGGTLGVYSGLGSGTLNDGVISTDNQHTQLFVTPAATDGTPIQPAIHLAPSSQVVLTNIDIYGGNLFGNSIPGKITGVTVTILDTLFVSHTQAFTTVPFNTFDDRIVITGSSLDGIAAQQITLSNFVGSPLFANWFSITELELNGEAVPAPSALGLLAIGGLAAARRRR